MSNVKLISRGVLGFVCSILMVILVLLLVLKVTVFNQKYVLDKLDSINYYDSVYTEIKMDMENNLLSSGLDESVLKDLFTKNEVKKDVKGFISAVYSGFKYEVNTDDISDRLKSNIDDYLKKNNVEVTDKDALDKFVSNIVDVYKKEISLYGYFDNHAGKFKGLNKYVDGGIILSIILLTIFMVILRVILRRKYEGVIALASGMMLMYFKFYIFEQIDMKNILIISDIFSKFVRKILQDIDNCVLFLSFVLIFLGIILNVINAYKKVKRKRRMS